MSSSVEPGVVGGALGAVNGGTKALTEGVGPLLFGSLMMLIFGGGSHCVHGVLLLTIPTRL
jgi:hypothetical protein